MDPASLGGGLMQILNIEARTHGRVLVRAAADARGVLFGFHGYSENAEIQMQRLESIPGAVEWTLVAVQGLHRFYRGRSEEIAASWMTRQDREPAIADNIDYVDRVVRAIGASRTPIVHIGFSQGSAMAFRAAVRGSHSAAGVISVGADVPPELLQDGNARFPRVLLARGEQDEWYTDAKLQADAAALAARGVDAATVVYAGGHEWTADVAHAAGTFLTRAFSQKP